jgi:hypothetical protein
MLFIVVANTLANNYRQFFSIDETSWTFADSKEGVRIAVASKSEADSSAALRNDKQELRHDKQETSNSKGQTNTEILSAPE